jgi:hypothetical protein
VENIITLQNELILKLYFPKMPVLDFKDIVVQIALFTRLKHDHNLIRDFNVFALLENVKVFRIIYNHFYSSTRHKALLQFRR